MARPTRLSRLGSCRQGCRLRGVDSGGHVGRAGHVAKQVSLGLFALTLVVVLPSLTWPQVLVLGARVTDPGDAAPWLFVGGLLVGTAGVVMSVVERHRRPGVREPRRRGSGAGRAVAIAMLVVTAGVVAGLGWLFSHDTDAMVLEPPSAGGCRVVVQEHSLLMSGSGTVFVLPAHDLVARRVSRYSTDDGYRPVASGSYSLTWTGEQGLLEVSGSGSDPVWPGLHEIDCPGR